MPGTYLYDMWVLVGHPLSHCRCFRSDQSEVDTDAKASLHVITTGVVVVVYCLFVCF